jgi:carbon monoxide dehydrogenase subunit G
MNLQGQYSMPATVEQIWAVIFDPTFMAKVMPGCREIDQTGDREYKMKLVLGIPGIQGQYQGRMLITDTEPLRRIVGDIDATGGLGKFQGQGALEFESIAPGTTRMVYSADVEIRGPMASMAGDFFEQVADQLMRQSLDSFADLLAAPATSATPPADQAESVPAAATVSGGPGMGLMAFKAVMAIIVKKIGRFFGFKHD